MDNCKQAELLSTNNYCACGGFLNVRQDFPSYHKEINERPAQSFKTYFTVQTEPGWVHTGCVNAASCCLTQLGENPEQETSDAHQEAPPQPAAELAIDPEVTPRRGRGRPRKRLRTGSGSAQPKPALRPSAAGGGESASTPPKRGRSRRRTPPTPKLKQPSPSEPRPAPDPDTAPADPAPPRAARRRVPRAPLLDESDGEEDRRAGEDEPGAAAQEEPDPLVSCDTACSCVPFNNSSSFIHSSLHSFIHCRCQC